MFQGDSNPDPQNQLEQKVNSSIPLYGDWQFSRMTFFLNFRVGLNLELIEARRKAHNKPINTLSGLVLAEERLRNLI